MSTRAVPFHCPYCGDENLWPHETDDARHGAWECRSCLRAFTVKMLGQIAPRGTVDRTVDRGSGSAS